MKKENAQLIKSKSPGDKQAKAPKIELDFDGHNFV